MMAEQIVANINRALDANDDPVAGAKAYFYKTGTTTPETVYSDSGLTTPHPSPLVADADGIFPLIFVSPGTQVKLDVKDPGTSASLPGYPIDPAQLVSTSGASAANVSFSPITGNSGTDVQAAIANNTSEILTFDNFFDLGVTAGTSSAYTATAKNTLTALASGQMFNVRFHAANTAGPTLNVDGQGAVALKYYTGGAKTALPANFVKQDTVCSVLYDGTDFVVVHGVAEGAKILGPSLGSAYQVLRVNSGATAPEWGGAGAPDVVLQHQEASGTAGGAATAGSWEIRKLTTIVRDVASLITLNTTTMEFSSSVDMWIEWRLSCMSTRWTKTRLYNVTDAVEAALGDSYFLSDANYDNVFIAGEAAIAAGKNYRFETRVSANRATDGYGFPVSFGTEIYATVKMWRL